jgi:hypothetical protein
LIVFIFFLFNLFLSKNEIKIEHYQNIVLLDSNKLFKILKDNEDNYYNKFYEIDFKMRNVNNIEEYIRKIEKSVDDFTDIEKMKIEECIYQANLKLSKIKLSWFNGDKSLKLPWIIGCIKGKMYENGLPHTRGNIIILNKENINKYNNKRLTELLIHEKIHIYQKYYHNDVLKYLLQENVNIVAYNELLPSLNDIFIKLVENTHATAMSFQNN